jgi:hypothetical protein
MCFRRAALLHLVLVAMTLLVACAHPYAPASYPPAPPSAILDMLLVDYRALGLPLPPPDAPLVRFGPKGAIKFRDSPVQTIYFLAFELPRAASEPPMVLAGTERIPIDDHARAVRVEPTAEAAEGTYGAWDGWDNRTPWGTNAALATAIQAKARGWDALAERLLDLASKTTVTRPRESCFIERPGKPSRQSLAILARAHFANELIDPGSDWAAIVPRFEAALAFGAPTRCDMKPFLRSLHLTLEHRRASPETIEAKIDALCDIANTTPGKGHTDAPAFRRIAELGFEAVPALLDHIEDARLTRSVEFNFKGWMQQFRLDAIVSDVLGAIAGNDAWCKYDHCAISPADARAWWAEAQAMGEEAYVVAHVLPAAPDAREPNGVVLRILARKYPRRLEEAYRAALARPHMSTRSLADAIAASALPEADRRRLLMQGAEHPTPAHRSAALRALQSLGHKPDGGAR